MQKRRFDLSRLRDGRLQLRDRANRLRAIQSLGSQVARVRQVRPRAEYIVPAICLLVLALALTWNALSTPNVTPPVVTGTTALSGTEVAVVGTVDPLATTVLGGATPTFVTGVAGGPYPGPEGVGTPVAGGIDAIPTVGPDGVFPTFEPSLEPPLITDTTTVDGFLTPTPPDFSAPPIDPSTGYPAPGQNPSPDQQPVVPEFPTTDPNAGGGFVFPTTDPNDVFTPPPVDVQQPVYPTDIPFPTPEPFPTDASYPAPEQPTDPFPTEEPLPDDGFPTAEVPTTDPNNPFPTDDPNNPFPGDPAATGGPATEATPVAPPTETPVPSPTAPPTATPTPRPTVTPTPDPAVLIQGAVRWPAQGPITLSQNHIVTPGSSLTIDPGVEVRIKPGVKLFVEGTLRAAGVAGAPVRIVGPEGRWSTITGQPGSTIVLEHTELRNAGRTGVALSSTGGSLVLRNVTLTDSGGGIVADGSAVDIRNSQITGNDLPTGPPLFVRAAPGTPVTLQGNIVGGNQVPNGTSNVRISVGNGGAGPLDIQSNAFTGGTGPLLDLQAAAAVGGTIRCNAFRGGTIGLQLSSSTPSAAGFSLAVDSNAFEGQNVYGIASTVALEAPNNWWGDPSGPNDAQRNPQGKGVRVGVNVGFAPQLPARPGCAPAP